MAPKRASERVKMAGGSKVDSKKKRKAATEEVQTLSEDSSSRTQSAEDVPPPPPPKKKLKKGQESGSGKKDKKKSGEKQKGIVIASPKSKKKETSKSEKKKKKVTEVATEDSNEGALEIFSEKTKVSGKEPELEDSWFINFTVGGQWQHGFASRPVGSCSLVNLYVLEHMGLKCIEMLKKSSLWLLLNPSEIVYPRLVRLFYLNLSQLSSVSHILQSKVAGLNMDLDHGDFSMVLGCPKRYDTDNHPPRAEILNLARKEFFLPNTPTKSKQLTHSVLTLEAKVLFTILTRCIVPRDNSRELVTDKILILMYLIMHGYEIDIPKIVMEHMFCSRTNQRKHPLPYGNLLTLFFKFKEIPVKGEETVTKGFGLLNEKAFENIGVVKTKDQVWKLYSDLTEEEMQAKKFKPKALNPAPNPQPQDLTLVIQKLESIEQDLEEVREHQLGFEMEMKQIRYMVEQTFKSSTVFDAPEDLSEEEGSLKDEGVQQTTEKQPSEEKEASDQQEENSPPSDTPLSAFAKKKKAIPEAVTEKDLFEEGDQSAKETDTGDGDEAAADEEQGTEEEEEAEEDQTDP